tara:strand:- start:3503 stop:4630 length:1128 start_codon:yes stop_codon:yes gene_type:complete
MKEVVFNPSEKPTVGVEIEAQLIDKESGNLVNVAEKIINEYGDEERVKHELYLSTVEVTSSPYLNTEDTYEELSKILNKVLEIAKEENAGLISAGAHPFALYEDQNITQVNPRYQEFADTYGWAVLRLLTFGMHVHVGMNSKEKAIAVHDEVRKYLPLILAMSTSSPFWRGRDTDLYCARLSIFQGLPNTGLPEPYYTWKEYEQSLQTLIKAGVIKPDVAYRQVWKDVRIHPEYGTVEIRIADSMPSLIDTVAVATFVQALCIKIGEDWEKGRLGKPTPTWLVENNRWAVIKEGLNAEFIIDSSGETKPITLVIKEIIESISSVAEGLGSRDNLFSINSLIDNDQVVDEMREISNQKSLVEVVHFLEKKLISSLQ